MSYFTPETIYTCRCINQDHTQCRVITIVFDEGGNATVGFTSEAIEPTDSRSVDVFADETNYTIDYNVITITNNLNQFWYVYFDDVPNPVVNAETVASGETVTITCPCKGGSGECTVAKGSGGGPCTKVTCQTTTICYDCKDPVVTVGSVSNEATFVLLQATSVQVES